jgi:predicted transcriptional regulator
MTPNSFVLTTPKEFVCSNRLDPVTDMARPSSSQPTPAELEILRILWARGPSTCREVYEALSRRDRIGYTTVLKILQIMVAKKLAARQDGDGRSHVYHAVTSESNTQQQMVRDLMDRAFGGSAAQLVVQALSAKPASAAELREIRQVLERAKGGKR